MRKELTIGLCVTSFLLGAWLSPALMAQPSEPSVLPINLRPGQGVTTAEPGGSVCEVQETSRQWIRCASGEWRNLETGYGFNVHPPRRLTP